MFKKIIGITLAIAMTLSLCACGGDKSVEAFSIPQWIQERKESSYSSDSTDSTKVNFYYDNTVGMYPFVCNASGESNQNGKAVVSGPLVNWISAVREILQNNKGTAYTLQKDENGEWRWGKYCEYSQGNVQNDIHNNFGSKDFYTFERGSLPKDGDAEVGPLAQLYFDNEIDNTAINIVLTDLAEQSVNNTELASCINSNILSQKGYAAGIIEVECEFNGTAYVPDPSRISNSLTQQVNGKRPLYMILTGPDSQLSAIYQNLLNIMKQQGMVENEDYYSYYQSSEANVNQVMDSDIVTGPLLKESSNNAFKKYFDNSIFADNVALTALDKGGVAELFGSEDYLDININAFEYTKIKSSDRMVLNYYVPLTDYDQFEESYQWRVATSKEDEAQGISSTEAVAMLDSKDYIQYDYIVTETVEVEEGEEEDVSSEDVTEDNQETRTRERKKRTTEKTVYNWYCSDTQNTSLKNFDDSFTLTYEQIDFEEGESHILAGAELYDQKGNAVSAEDGGGRGSRSFELDADDDIDLSAADHWIHIQVEGKGSYDSSTVAFDIPIYAYVSTANSMPSWVTELNATASDASSSTYASRTFNLVGFYSTLFGVNSNSDESVYQIEREVKIADIVTVITGLPSSKSSR